jgi:hypothetical protein
MSCSQWLQVVGLSFALVGAVLLSLDKLGKDRIHGFVSRCFERFRRHRKIISWAIGSVVAIVAISLIDIWTTPLVSTVVPPMFKWSIISICASTIWLLVITQLVLGGRASFRQTGVAIATAAGAFCRVIASPHRWEPLLRRFKDQMISGFRLFMNPSRIVVILRRNVRRIIRVLSATYLYVFILGLAIAYLTTQISVFWSSSITFGLTTAIVFILFMLGFLLERIISGVLRFLVREDAERTFARFSIAGFLLLGVGFGLQMIGVIKI